MIISHEHRYIFIKTPKTAGTSIEIALSRYCGPRDVVTPISPVDEETRRSLGGRGPQNVKVPRSRWRARDWAKWSLGRGRPRFFNHAGAEFIRRYLPSSQWDTYYKFCFERNPWDKAISRYYWDYRETPRPPLADYIREELPSKRRGWAQYTIDGKITVDCVYRFEDLAAALDDLVDRFGFSEGLSLPRAKGGHRPERSDPAELLGPAERDAIGRLFAEEIQAWGYTFGP